MKNRSRLLALSVCGALAAGMMSASAFAEAATEAAQSAGTHTMTDADEREVTVPDSPQAIAINNTVLPHMVFALQGGYGDNIIAMNATSFAGYQDSIMAEMDPQLADTVNTTVMGDTINVEALAELNPDLVFLWQGSEDAAEQLDGLGIPSVVLKGATDWDSLKSVVTMTGEALNQQENAEKICSWLDTAVDYVGSRADQISALSDEEKPRTLIFQYVDGHQIYSKGMNPGIIESVGGQNIVLTGSSADTGAPTMEEILEFDPEVIFISNFDDYTPDDFYNNNIEGEDWSTVSAVKNHRVYKVPKGLYRWAPPNSIEKPLFLKWVGKILQPDIFSDADLKSDMKNFYKDYLGYDITDEQIDKVLHTDLNGDVLG